MSTGRPSSPPSRWTLSSKASARWTIARTGSSTPTAAQSLPTATLLLVPTSRSLRCLIVERLRQLKLLNE
jgi:hypothetical protein